jgi:glycosyltransferase involved in cell wall biosynthesis
MFRRFSTSLPFHIACPQALVLPKGGVGRLQRDSIGVPVNYQAHTLDALRQGQEISMRSKSKIHVLQLGSPTGLYGAERWILALVKHLDPSRVTSTIAVIKDDPSLDVPLRREAEKFGFLTRVFEAYGKANWDAVRQLRHFLAEEKVHILHTHGYKQDIIALLAARGTGCKLVTTPHGWSTHADLKLKCYELFDRCLFPFFDAVVPLSEELYRPLRSIPRLNGKLRLIENGVDLSEVDSFRELASELAEWRAQGSFVIGYIGQLISRKGLTVLLQAVAKLEGLNWRLALLGTGDQEAELRCIAGQLGLTERVEFFGFRDDRLAFLRGFDAFVLPSRLEGIPRCLMEAMAAEVPVIATDIPGCHDIVTDRETGLLFPVDEPTELAARLRILHSDPSLRKRMGEAGKDAVRSRYSAARMAREYEQLFGEL